MQKIKKVYNREMEPEEKQKSEELNITFKNGALIRIKKLAQELNIHEDRVEDVVTKAVSLMDAAKEGNFVTIKKDKQEYVIDLRVL